MNGIHSSYAIATALCLFSMGIVRGRIPGAARIPYLSWYLALEALCFVLELLVAHPRTPLKALWLGSLMIVSLLVAPCLWLAVTEAVDRTRKPLSSLRWPHAAVIAAGAALTVPLIASAHFGTEFVNATRTTPTLLEPFIHAGMLLCLALFACQVPYYLQLCRRRLLPPGTACPPNTRRWLQLPLVIVCTTWLLGIVRTLASALFDGVEPLFAAAAVIDIAVTVPCVFILVRGATAPSDGSAGAGPKYAKCRLDSAVRERIRRKLDAAFRDGIHTNANLSLGLLSRAISENEHYVSHVINEALDTSFYELVNRHRIGHAQRMLLAEPHRSVLDVALGVGFNAKSTFNGAFRRLTGMTPSAFRASHASLVATHGSQT